MNSDRKNAITLGILFVLATVTAIIGLVLYEPILNDTAYLMHGPENANQVILGVLFELIAACSVVGTAIMWFPYLKKHNESIALGYVCFRCFEAVIIVVGSVSLLSLLTLGQTFASEGALDASALQTSGALLQTVYRWTAILGPNFLLGINTMICGYLLYQTRIVPRFIAAWGLIGATLIFIAAVLEIFGVIVPFSVLMGVLALPVATYEMVLAVWLIVKGFNSSKVTFEVIDDPAPSLA